MDREVPHAFWRLDADAHLTAVVAGNRRDPAMSAGNKLVRVLWMWVAPLAALAALALACFFYFHSPGQRNYRLSVTAGNALGMRHNLAVRLQGEAARNHLAFELRPSHGSEEALDWVNRREVDVALVQGGLTTAGRPDVRQVATLHIEPMHLAVKGELARDASASLLALRGKAVDLSEVGSGTRVLATAALDFVGLQPRDLDPARGYVPVSLDRQHLFAEQDTARLPDAVFLVSTLPSSTVRYLVTRHGYRLVPLPFAEALALESLEERAADDPSVAGGGSVVLGRVQAATVPAYTYGIEPPVPERPLPTLGTRLLLVAHKDVPPRAAYQLVEAVYASEFGQVVHPPLDAKLLELPPEFPWHAGTVLYQQRNTPLLSGAVMDSAHKGFAIFAAAASGLFVLWQWAKLRGRVTRDGGFKGYITQVARIEERALEAERGAPLAVPELLALRDQLHRLKAEALGEFAEEELAGKDLLLGFLVQVNDVRDYVTRLIRHRQAAEARVPASSSVGE
jgi:TRAP-type uncharacterized transport system substrate-binding protein